MANHAALSVAAANLLGRVTGLLRDVIFAAVFGASATSDAFNAAFRVPQLLRELLVEGSLQNVVVPAFADAEAKEGAEAAWKLANAVLGVLLVVLSVATLGFIAGAPFFVQLVAGGFADDAEKFALTVSLTRWLSPFLAGLSLAALLGGLLNVRGRFFIPAMAQNVISVFAIGACLAGGRVEAATGFPAITLVALATTVAGFVQVGLCLPQLAAEGFRFRPTFRGHPALGRLLGFFATAFVGIVTVQFNILVESQYASRYGDGVLTWLLGSFRLVQLPLALVAGSLTVAMLPKLAAEVSRGGELAAKDTLVSALRSNAFLVLPAAVGLGVLAEPIVGLVYERGAFDHADTVGTGSMLQMYAFACYGICLHRMLVPVYYALGRPRFPMWLSLGTMAAKLPAIWLLTRGFGMGAEALPLSHAITVTGECVGLAWGLRTMLSGTGMVGFHLRAASAAAALGGVAWFIGPALPVLVTIAISGAVYLGLARLLGAWALPGAGRPDVPPFVEPSTAGWLTRAQSESVEVRGDQLVVGGVALRVAVLDGALVLRGDGEGGEPSAPSANFEAAKGADLVLGIEPGRDAKLVSLEAGGMRWHVRENALTTGARVRIPLPRRA